MMTLMRANRMQSTSLCRPCDLRLRDQLNCGRLPDSLNLIDVMVTHACDVSPDPARPLPDGWQRRKICGQLLPRLVAPAGGDLVVLADGGGFSACWAFGAAGVYRD